MFSFKGHQLVDIKVLGQGSYGKVHLTEDFNTKKRYAFKIVKKDKYSNPLVAKREYQNLKELKHENIIKLYDYADVNNQLNGNKIYLVMEYAAGGTLHDFITNDIAAIQNADERINISKKLFREIVTGVQYIHAQNIVHCDLKPTNILLDSNKTIKIADFGSSLKITDEKGIMAKRVGTRGYAAPEASEKGTFYDGFKADMYSLGIILRDIVKAYKKYEMPEDCEIIFKKLTSTDPNARPSADDFLKETWLA